MGKIECKDISQIDPSHINDSHLTGSGDDQKSRGKSLEDLYIYHACITPDISILSIDYIYVGIPSPHGTSARDH